MPEITLILDNIRSLYNVGSMFRTADAFGVKKIYLCGITGTPLQRGVSKVALGAEGSVPWEHRAHSWRVIEELRDSGMTIVALETSDEAELIQEHSPSFPLVLIVGNEVRGLSGAILRRADTVLRIPMSGMKESLNVAVSCGIALYHLRHPRTLP